MKTKRFGRPRVKNGELKVQWGTIDKHNSPDICFLWGESIKNCDGNLLYCMLGTKRQRLLYGEEIQENNGIPIKYDKSLLEELQYRGMI